MRNTYTHKKKTHKHTNSEAINKQKTSKAKKEKIPRQNNLRQKSPRILLSSFYNGHLSVGMGSCKCGLYTQ